MRTRACRNKNMGHFYYWPYLEKRTKIASKNFLELSASLEPQNRLFSPEKAQKWKRTPTVIAIPNLMASVVCRKCVTASESESLISAMFYAMIQWSSKFRGSWWNRKTAVYFSFYDVIKQFSWTCSEPSDIRRLRSLQCENGNFRNKSHIQTKRPQKFTRNSSNLPFENGVEKNVSWKTFRHKTWTVWSKNLKAEQKITHVHFW